MGVFTHTPKSKLVSLQDATYCPENSSLPPAEFFDKPEIRKKMKSKRELGVFRVQQGSRTTSNLSKEKCWEERFPTLDEEEYVNLPRAYSDTCTVLMPILSVQTCVLFLVCSGADIFLRFISNHLPAFFPEKVKFKRLLMTVACIWCSVQPVYFLCSSCPGYYL